MEVAVFVDSHRAVGAHAECCFGFVGEVDTDAPVFGFYVYEGNMMTGEHWVDFAAYLHFDTAVVDTCYYGQMLFTGSVNSIGNKFLHLLTTAYNGNTGVNNFDYNVATMIAFKKFYRHKY